MSALIPRTIALMKVTWHVLQYDRRLFLLPVLGAEVAGSIFGLMLLELWVTGFFSRAAIDIGGITVYRLLTESDVDGVTILDIAVVAAAYIGIFGALAYFNAVLFVAAKDLVEGRRRPLGDAFSQVSAKLPELVGWTCFSLTLGIAIQAARSSDHLLLKIPGMIAGYFWAFATYFVVPVIVVEGLTPVAALRRSTLILKQTWGLRLVSQFGFSLAFFGVFLLAIIPCLAFVLGAPAIFCFLLAVTCFPAMIVGLVLVHAMNQVFQVAIFTYASTGVSPEAFPAYMVRGAYRPRKAEPSEHREPPTGHRQPGHRKLPEEVIEAQKDRRFL